MLFNSFLKFIHPDKRKLIYSLYFKSRYLIVYIFIGIISIIFELQIRSFLIKFGINELKSSIISLPVSIIVAFLLNINFNFKIQRKKCFQENDGIEGGPEIQNLKPKGSWRRRRRKSMFPKGIVIKKTMESEEVIQ